MFDADIFDFHIGQTVTYNGFDEVSNRRSYLISTLMFHSSHVIRI